MGKFLIILFIFLSFFANAQTNTISQNLSYTPILNPAYTGAIEHSRMFFMARNQYIALNSGFNSMIAAYDYYNKNNFLGFGGIVQYFKAPSGFSKTSFTVQASEVMQLNPKIGVRFGIQFTFTNTQNGGKYIFGNQLTNDGLVISNVTDISDLQSNNFNVSLGSGMILYGKKWWIGSSFWNLNRPKESNLIIDEKIKINFNTSIGYRFYISRATGLQREVRKTLTTSINLKKWENAYQAEFLAVANLNPILLGSGFRGLPILNQEVLQTNALYLLTGFRTKQFMMAYSYDLPINKLGFTTGGAHEVTFTILFGEQPVNGRKSKRKVDFNSPLFF